MNETLEEKAGQEEDDGYHFHTEGHTFENDNLGLCSTTEPICSNFFVKSIFTSEDSKRNPATQFEIF